ncbi:putative protein FAR1-RELATED SEQUENCE 10 [Phalaenopsis equestris]|uniref:putative protein FAR1-RELATED SEQUENCE 10 n=1 Tax=Phalaenopsis equestris TaxID=78828 RepID=UPI0009E30D52|nr:putative protein FAR1-RELATED SEQUENCE 10 [Phalaenopsis equestris]
MDLICANVQPCEQIIVCSDPIAKKFLSIIVHNEQKAYEIYCAYAHHVGFSVRKDHNSCWSNPKKRKTKDFLCGKAGHKKDSNLMNTVKYKKPDTMTGCQAMVRYAVDLKGNWTVNKFIKSHNHHLVECSDKHLLPSGKKITNLNADVLRSMTGSGIGITNAYNFFVT